MAPRDWLMGRWTDSNNCSVVTQLLPDGRVIFPGGATSAWAVIGNQLIVGAKTYRIEVASGDTLVLSDPDGSRGTSVRCPGIGTVYTGLLNRAPSSVGPRTEPNAQAPTRGKSIRSPNRSVDARSVPNAAGLCPRKLQNNDWLDPWLILEDPTHTVIVKNGSNAPAVVKIVETDGRGRALFYVARGASANVPVNSGRYRIQYAVGGRLAADCQTVIQPTHVAEFPRIQDFRVQRSSTGYSTQVLELTLYQVPGGNVRTRPISTADFNRD